MNTTPDPKRKRVPDYSAGPKAPPRVDARARYVPGIIATNSMGRLRLRAGDELRTVRHDPGDLQIRGLHTTGPHAVTFSEYYAINSAPDALPFLRAHGTVDIVYGLDLTDYGPLDRQLVAEQCTLVDVALVEQPGGGTVLRHTLTAERLSGDLLAFLRGGE